MIRSPRDFNEMSHLYGEDHEEHQCGYCAEGETTMSEQIGFDDVVRFSTGREATGRELSKHAAGQTLTNLALQHQARKGGTFSQALIEMLKICPGEFREYLQYQLPDASRPMPRGVKKVTEIVFRASEGWTQAGVADWLEEQGMSGGTLTSTNEGWTYVPEPYVSAFPR